jgi:stage IV sporulation protein FB
VISALLILLGIVQFFSGSYNISLFIVGLYALFSSKALRMEAALMNIKDIIYRRSRLLKKGIYQARDLVVLKGAQLGETIKAMDFDRFHVVYVLDDNLKIVGMFTEQEIIDELLKTDTDPTFEEFMKKVVQDGC